MTVSRTGCLILSFPIIHIHLFKRVITQTEQPALLSCRGLKKEQGHAHQ